MGIGLFTGVLSGVVWGLVFVAPMALPNYSAVQLTWGRYFAFGVISLLPLLWLKGWRQIRQLSAGEWAKALELTLWGNVLYYLLIAIAVQRIGGALTGAFIGLLPLLVSVIGNVQAGKKQIAWRRLLPALGLLFVGLALLYRQELIHLHQLWQSGREMVLGTVCAVLGLFSWTIYALRNASYLARKPQIDNVQWTGTQGLVTLV